MYIHAWFVVEFYSAVVADKSQTIMTSFPHPQPPIPTAKIVHSPLNNENTEASPHSAWSPIRRKTLAAEDACFQCTKRSFR